MVRSRTCATPLVHTHAHTHTMNALNTKGFVSSIECPYGSLNTAIKTADDGAYVEESHERNGEVVWYRPDMEDTIMRYKIAEILDKGPLDTRILLRDVSHNAGRFVADFLRRRIGGGGIKSYFNTLFQPHGICVWDDHIMWPSTAPHKDGVFNEDVFAGSLVHKYLQAHPGGVTLTDIQTDCGQCVASKLRKLRTVSQRLTYLARITPTPPVLKGTRLYAGASTLKECIGALKTHIQPHTRVPATGWSEYMISAGVPGHIVASIKEMGFVKVMSVVQHSGLCVVVPEIVYFI